MDDREATQKFTVRNVLISHCGEELTQEKVDIISAELISEMLYGSTSWAFKQEKRCKASSK